MGGFFFVLVGAGWHWGDAVGTGSALHHGYVQATTMTFLGIVACQIGTAFAARTDRASLRQVGVLTNRLLLWGIAFEVVFAVSITVIPGLRSIFETSLPPASAIAMLLPFPFIVWGADELRRWLVRRSLPATAPVPNEATAPTSPGLARAR